MAWRRTDYLDQYRSSETICLRPTHILQLNKTKRTFHQVQFIWKPTRLQILQEHKYYTECMRTIYILQNHSNKLAQTDDIRLPDETKHGIWKTVFCVLWSTSARSHLGGLEKIIASSLGWLRYCRADNMSALWDHMLSCCNKSYQIIHLAVVGMTMFITAWISNYIHHI